MRIFVYTVIIYQLLLQGLFGLVVENISVLRIVIDLLIYSLAVVVVLTKDIKLDKLLIVYFSLFFVAILSSLFGDADYASLIKQLRFTFLGGAFYILVTNIGLDRQDFKKLFNICFFIGYIQLPIVVFQLMMFGKGLLKNQPQDYVDVGTGTVGFMDSGVTGMYLVLLLIIKLQKIAGGTYSKLDFIKIVLLASPLGLINSDAQFIFLPLIIIYILIMNFRLNRRTLVYFSGILLVGLVANQLVLNNWSGDRDIVKYINSKVYHLLNTEPDYNPVATRMLRYDSMRYVVERSDHSQWLLGSGPGYWLTRDSEGGPSSITKVWYHANSLLLSYGEMGVLGLMCMLMFPLVYYLNGSNSLSGRVLKAYGLYMFLLLFYQHPLNKLSVIILFMLVFAYHNYTKRFVFIDRKFT